MKKRYWLIFVHWFIATLFIIIFFAINTVPFILQEITGGNAWWLLLYIVLVPCDVGMGFAVYQYILDRL